MTTKQFTEDTSNSQNVKIVYRLYEAKARGDEETVSSIIDSKVKLEVMENFPHGGTYHGYKAMNDFFTRLLQDFDDWYAEPQEILDAGDNVVSLGHYHGIAKNTGIKVIACFVHIISLRDWKVVRMRQYTDTVKFARALANEN